MLKSLLSDKTLIRLISG